MPIGQKKEKTVSIWEEEMQNITIVAKLSTSKLPGDVCVVLYLSSFKPTTIIVIMDKL